MIRVRFAKPDDATAIATIYNHFVLHTTVTFEDVPPGVDEVTARIAAAQERHAWFLRQRLATGHRHISRAVGRHRREDFIKRLRFAAAESVGGVAIHAAQRAAGQADENRRQAAAAGFALQRMKNFGDAQRIGEA